GGSLSVANASAINGAFTLAAGIVGGAGDFTLANASNTWSGGTMSGSGKTTVASGAALNITGSGARTSNRAMQIDGSVTVSSGGALIPVFSSLAIGASGKLDLADNAMIIDYSGSTPLTSIQSLIDS